MHFKHHCSCVCTGIRASSALDRVCIIPFVKMHFCFIKSIFFKSINNKLTHNNCSINVGIAMPTKKVYRRIFFFDMWRYRANSSPLIYGFTVVLFIILVPFCKHTRYYTCGFFFARCIKVGINICCSEYQQSSHVGVLRYFFSGGGVLSISL